MVKLSRLILITLGSLWAQNVGTQAPDFTLQTLDHGTINLADQRGKTVYLFFLGYG